MLITSDTMPPLLDNNGNPVRNGWLRVNGTSKALDKYPLLLYSNPDYTGDLQDNPIQLDSTGRMPKPFFVKESLAWCFLFTSEFEPVRSYPLQTHQETGNLMLPQDLRVRRLTVDDVLRANKIEARQTVESETIKAGSITVKTPNGQNFSEIYSLQAGSLQIGKDGTVFDDETIISPVALGIKGSWQSHFLLGGYGIYISSTPRELNEIVTIGGESGDVLVSQGDSSMKARICGRTNNAQGSGRYYLVCRVE